MKTRRRASRDERAPREDRQRRHPHARRAAARRQAPTLPRCADVVTEARSCGTRQRRAPTTPFGAGEPSNWQASTRKTAVSSHGLEDWARRHVGHRPCDPVPNVGGGQSTAFILPVLIPPRECSHVIRLAPGSVIARSYPPAAGAARRQRLPQPAAPVTTCSWPPMSSSHVSPGSVRCCSTRLAASGSSSRAPS